MRPWMYLLSALVAVPSLPSCRDEPSTAIIVAGPGKAADRNRDSSPRVRSRQQTRPHRDHDRRSSIRSSRPYPNSRRSSPPRYRRPAYRPQRSTGSRVTHSNTVRFSGGDRGRTYTRSRTYEQR